MTQASKDYAAALFELAQETGAEQEISSSLSYMLDIFRRHPQYTDLLASPSIPADEREAALRQAFCGSVHEYALSFVCLLCRHGSIKLFEECAAEYEHLYQASQKISPARIVSAVPLTDGEKERLVKSLEKMSGRSVLPEYVVDASIIGGAVVYMDGRVIDGSIKRRLTDAKEVLDK